MTFQCSHGLTGKCRQCYDEAMLREDELHKERKPKSLKEKKCKEGTCRKMFIPRNSMQVVCSPRCGELYAKACRVKKERKETRRQLDAIATLPQLKKKAQAAFNAFIRARDKGKPCICCPRPLTGDSSLTGGTVDAGHYRSVGSAPHLRFNEDNCHGQSKHCNQYKSGNAVAYRIGLIARIGLERVEALEADNTPRHYTKQELIELAAFYRRKTRDLQKGSE